MEMFTEDLFDGWLDVPSITGFLAIEASSDCVKQAKLLSETDLNELSVPEKAQSSLNGNLGSQLPVLSSQHALATSNALRPRKGHSKSRLGCINCKGRKVKCSETWPSCTACTKRGTVCRYLPAVQDALRRRMVAELPSPRPVVQLSSAPTTFTGNDLRMFHHYMVTAYPCIPLAYESVWVKDVPMLSHQYSYLMHAILSLAGLHIGLQAEDPNIKATLSHRQKAIHGLEECFKRWPPPPEEAHIMLATSYLLCYQSTFIEDGFLESVLSLRGCSLISQFIRNEGFKGPFAVEPNMLADSMEKKFERFPHLDQELAHTALQSIRNFKHLLIDLPDQSIEKALVASFVESIRPLLISDKNEPPSQTNTPPNEFLYSIAALSIPPTPTTPNDRLHTNNSLIPTPLDQNWPSIDWATITDAPLLNPDPLLSFNALMSSILVLANWPQADLMHLFDPSNQLGNVIMAHFLAVRFVIPTLSVPQTGMKAPVGAMMKWAERIIDAVVDEDGMQWTRYIEWPRRILRCMQACVEQKRGLTFGDLHDMLIHDPGAFKEGRARRWED